MEPQQDVIELPYKHPFRIRAERAERQRDDLFAALKAVVENFGPWHDDDCPADDTCDCSAKPIHDAVNSAMRAAEGR